MGISCLVFVAWVNDPSALAAGQLLTDTHTTAKRDALYLWPVARDKIPFQLVSMSSAVRKQVVWLPNNFSLFLKVIKDFIYSQRLHPNLNACMQSCFLLPLTGFCLFHSVPALSPTNLWILQFFSNSDLWDIFPQLLLGMPNSQPGLQPLLCFPLSLLTAVLSLSFSPSLWQETGWIVKKPLP